MIINHHDTFIDNLMHLIYLPQEHLCRMIAKASVQTMNLRPSNYGKCQPEEHTQQEFQESKENGNKYMQRKIMVLTGDESSSTTPVLTLKTSPTFFSIILQFAASKTWIPSRKHRPSKIA
jgi:enterochelin esterase-like enzyme